MIVSLNLMTKQNNIGIKKQQNFGMLASGANMDAYRAMQAKRLKQIADMIEQLKKEQNPFEKLIKLYKDAQAKNDDISQKAILQYLQELSSGTFVIEPRYTIAVSANQRKKIK